MFGVFRKAVCCGLSEKTDTEDDCDEEQDLVINSQPINTVLTIPINCAMAERNSIASHPNLPRKIDENNCFFNSKF